MLFPKQVICIVLLLAAFIGGLKAQAPGYLGKRWVVGYGLNFSPVTYGSSNGNKTLFYTDGSAEQGKLAFNLIHEGYFEYAFAAKWTIGIAGRRYKTVYDNRQSLEYQGSPANYYRITGFSVVPYFKIFRSGYLAPWGSYFLLGPVFNNISATYDHTVYDPHTGERLNLGPAKSSRLAFDNMVGWGKVRVIADRLVIDYGFNMQLFATIVDVWKFIYEDNGYISRQDYIDVTSRQRARGMNRFNFYVRFGLLW